MRNFSVVIHERKFLICHRAKYGCYTIGDNWTFVQGLITGLENDLPSLTIQHSREYAERLEAITILQILKYIVRTYLTALPPLPSIPV